MITELDIHLPLARALREDARRKAAAQKLQISPHRIKGMRLVKESIDARRRPICKQLRLLVGVDEELPPAALPERHYTSVGKMPRQTRKATEEHLRLLQLIWMKTEITRPF